MEIENQILEQNLQNITVIKKDEHNPTDLEESINQCLLNLNNDGKKINEKNDNQKPKIHSQHKKNISPKSNNHTQKEKILEIKEKITQIFNDNINVIQNVSVVQEKNDKELNKTIMDAQTTFEEEIDKLYNEKIIKLKEIEKKYQIDLFDLKNYSDEEIKWKKENQKAILKFIYDSVKEDKENEIKEIENDFQKKKKIITDKYKNASEQKEDFTLDDRSVIYKNELFENLKNKINEVIYPNDKQKVSIALENNNEQHNNNILKGIEG